jgi:FtsH-binding integral membrane protein
MAHGREYELEGYGYDGFAADAALDERRAFIQRTYAHVFGAILAFVGLEALVLGLMSEAMKAKVAVFMFSSWFLVLGAFILVSWLAGKWASSEVSVGTQYVGLGLFVIAEVVIFMPLLIIASSPQFHGSPDVIPTAAFLTLLIFGGLTAVVLLTKKDFSFLGNVLWVLSLAALGLIFVSMFWGFSLGTWFVVGMIVLMSGYILYDTSNILHHYRTTQHVAAALALFASVATLFWYVLQFTAASDD